MLMAGKVEYCAKLSHQAVQDGMCVVIGLQSTGEANTNAVSTASGGGALLALVFRAHHGGTFCKVPAVKGMVVIVVVTLSIVFQ
jgi:hypothetical protein